MLTLQWDDANRNHVARHGISMAEVEQALSRSPIDLGTREENNELRFSFLGDTARGRILLVVLTERENLLRPVTAFEPSAALRRRFLQSRQNDES